MTLKDQAAKFVQQIRAGQIGDALDTAADILKASAGFYKVLFGGGQVVAVTVTPEDLAGVEAELNKVYDEVATTPAAVAAAGQAGGAAVDPALILLVIDVILKVVAERRRGK